MRKLVEGAEMNDLARLVNPKLSIDEYRSKMGDDKDVVVLGITIFGKEPGEDLVSFVEKSYDWVLDADLSSGETSDGNYIVFIELQRNDKAANHIFSMITDMLQLTGQEIDEWNFTYFKDTKSKELTLENLKSTIVLSAKEYEMKYDDSLKESYFNSLRALAGVYINPSKIVNKDILQMQRSAGIK